MDRSEERVERIFRGLAGLPSLPEAVERLVELSGTEATPRQFAELISADQGLTAKVLKLVNSAFYGLPKPISSLQHATTLLGTKTLKSLVLGVSVMQLFRKGCEGFEPLEYWKHSVAVAAAAQRLAVALRPGVEDHLYVAGLLHDTGIALFAERLPEDYALVLRLHRQTRRPLCGIERELFGTCHCELGHRLVRRWQFPVEVGDAIRHHELRGPELAARLPEGASLENVQLLQLAEAFVSSQGYEFPPPGEARRDAGQPPELEVPCWIDGTPEDLAGIVGEIGAEVDRVEHLLGAAESGTVPAG